MRVELQILCGKDDTSVLQVKAAMEENIRRKKEGSKSHLLLCTLEEGTPGVLALSNQAH